MLADDLAAARGRIVALAKQSGLQTVEIDSDIGIPTLDVHFEDAEPFLELARSVGAPAIYLSGPRSRKPGRTAQFLDKAVDDAEALVAAAGEGDPEAARAGLRRMADLLREDMDPVLYASFLHAGVMHTLRVTDRAAAPALDLLEKLERILRLRAEAARATPPFPGEEEELGGSDGSEWEEPEEDFAPDLRSADPRDLAQSIIRALKAGGASRREMRRDGPKIVRQVIRDMYPPPDALNEVERRKLQEARHMAERRLRKGDF